MEQEQGLYWGVSVVSEFADGSDYGGDYEDQGVGGECADEDFAGETESIVEIVPILLALGFAPAIVGRFPAAPIFSPFFSILPSADHLALLRVGIVPLILLFEVVDESDGPEESSDEEETEDEEEGHGDATGALVFAGTLDAFYAAEAAETEELDGLHGD